MMELGSIIGRSTPLLLVVAMICLAYHYRADWKRVAFVIGVWCVLSTALAVGSYWDGWRVHTANPKEHLPPPPLVSYVVSAFTGMFVIMVFAVVVKDGPNDEGWKEKYMTTPKERHENKQFPGKM